MTIAVFLGPSLPRAVADSILQAQYLPPAGQGDLLKLLPQQPNVVVVIDGLFEDRPAIWHNEILLALERGVKVIGAASMGALRAAELWRYGMMGVGCIFRAYRRSWLNDNSEVAVLHAPVELGAFPLTEALVNVRATCRAAIRENVLSTDQASAFVTFAAGIYYKDRTWERLLGQLGDQPLGKGVLSRFSDWTRLNRVDLKARDAAMAIRRAGLIAAGAIRPVPYDSISVEPTDAWLRFLGEPGTPTHDF